MDCYQFRADILDGRGDWAGARQAYAQAVAKFVLANQKGPQWADPLKVWGDVLVKQGDTKETITKYDEALKYAPNCKQLKEAREATAKTKI